MSDRCIGYFEDLEYVPGGLQVTGWLAHPLRGFTLAEQATPRDFRAVVPALRDELSDWFQVTVTARDDDRDVGQIKTFFPLDFAAVDSPLPPPPRWVDPASGDTPDPRSPDGPNP